VAIGSASGDDDDYSNRTWRGWEIIKLPGKKFGVPTIKLPKLPPSVPLLTKTVPTIVQGVQHSRRSKNYFSAILVLCLQAVLLFDACTSADKTIGVVFLTLAFALALPGCVFAFGYNPFNRKRKCPI
jgi:hypothetical protein